MNGIDKKILITAVMAIALATVLVFDYSDESAADPSGNILDSGSNVIGTYTLNGYTLTLTATSVSDETSITLSGITAGEKATVQKLVITGFTSDITHSFDDYTAINSIEYSGSVSTGGKWTFNYLDGEIALVPSGDNEATAIELNDFKMQSLVTSVLIRGYYYDLSGSFSTYPALQNNITYKGSFTGTYGGIWEYQVKTKTLIVDRSSGSSASFPGTYSQENAPFLGMFFKNDVQNVEYRTFTSNSQNLFYGLTSVKTFRGTHFNESNNYSILYGMENTLEELRYDRISSVQSNTISVVKANLKVFIADSAKDVSARTFSNATKLATINLPSAETVGEFAFTGCTSLQIINLDSVLSLGRYAFNGCTALRDISLPSATSLGTFAFTGCSSLRSVTLSSEAAIGDSCFINATSLTTVVFNKQVTLGEAAFSGCSNLVNITSSKIASIGLDAFNGCAKMTGEGGVFDLTALKTINSSSAKYPFRGCVAITTIMMPAVTTMGPYAFNGCTNLATVTIGNNLGEISNYAFYSCAKLSSVTIGNDLVIVGDHAFDGCSALDSLEIPDSTETIGDSAFANSGILAFDTKNVLSIGADAFRNSAISTLDLGDMIQTIGDNAFRASSISGDLVFPASITSIGTYAFAQISVSTITFTDGGSTPVEIGNSAFRDCSALTTVNLGNCVKSLGTEAFCNCTAMSAMSFGTGMESIGDRAFSGCNTMSAEVTIPKNTTYIGVDSFKGTNIRSLTFAEDSVLETISAGAFQDCRSLRRIIEIPDSVTEIGQNAFNNSAIRGLTFDVTESKLTTIGASAFVNCSSLTGRVDLPLNLQTIGNEAFNGCNITGLGLGPKLATLGQRAFQNNSNLTEVVIPNTVTPLTIPAYAFNGCGLTDIYLSSSVASIAANAFYCTTVTASQVNIWFNGPLSGITIADGAFRFNNIVTAVVYTDPSSESVDLKNKISSVSKITYERRMSGNISFSTTEGTLLYNQITAIYGSKIILPYYALGSGGYGSLYYAVRDNSETNQYLSVFASEADFNAHSESNNRVARSGYVVPVYPLSDKDSIRMYGFTVTDSFVDTMTITTESSGLPVDIVSQTSHYGGIIRIPSFVQSDLIIKNAVTIKSADGLKAYTLAVDTVSVYAGINYSQITLGYEDVYIDVTFIGWDQVEHVASVKLRSSFAIPVELQYLEENPDGYRFNGWWDAPGTSGVRADEYTKFDFNDKWYVNFQPLTYTLELKTKSADPSEPTHESTWTLYGPYSLHVVGNSLYYTDAVNTNKVMMFEGNSILGWTVSNYQDNRGRNYTGDTEPMIGDRIGDNAVFIRLTMNLYDLTLEFYNAGVAIDAAQVFKIRGWEVGDGEEFHFGSIVEDVPYSKIQNGLNLPVPVNQTYAFNNMVAGSTPVPKADDGHYYLRITYFESSDSITIRYNMDIGVYTVEFTMNDDTSSVFVDGPFNVGDEVWLNSTDYYTKIGYQFHHYSIAGDATEYRDGRNVVITDAMVGSSSYCVISVTAVWAPLDYSVTFDLGDYTAEIPAQTVNNGGTVTLPVLERGFVSRRSDLVGNIKQNHRKTVFTNELTESRVSKHGLSTRAPTLSNCIRRKISIAHADRNRCRASLCNQNRTLQLSVFTEYGRRSLQIQCPMRACFVVEFDILAHECVIFLQGCFSGKIRLAANRPVPAFHLALGRRFAYATHNMTDTFGFAPLVESRIPSVIGSPLGTMIRKYGSGCTVFLYAFFQYPENVIRRRIHVDGMRQHPA
ncbi:adhesin-like protein [methanogenic archaeon ISO4-H5]|nr:adhesin-like protein [methanogenic archaeon ISO4-H5]